jgi:Spy/CpxP family protein refolding chaperone
MIELKGAYHMRFTKWMLITTLTLAATSVVAVYAESIPPSGPSLPSPSSFSIHPIELPRTLCPSQVISFPGGLDSVLQGNFLRLSDEQRENISVLADKYRKKMTDESNAVREAAHALLVELVAEKTSSGHAQDLAAKAGKAEAASLKTIVAFMTDLKDILTPEQNAKISGLLSQMMAPKAPPFAVGPPPRSHSDAPVPAGPLPVVGQPPPPGADAPKPPPADK